MTSTTTDRLTGVENAAAVKTPCRIATTTNITLADYPTIDGTAVVDNDRVLVKDQTNAVDNGIYVVGPSAWSRAKDFDGARDVVENTQVYAADGASQSAGIYFMTTASPVIGVSPLVFEKLSVTSAAIGDISGLQTALDAKVDLTGDTLTGPIAFSGTDHPGIKLVSLTTTQRNLLTPAAGWVIYNSSTTHIEGYQGGQWVDLGAQAGVGSGDMVAATYDAAGIAQQLVGLTASQTLTNKTLTSPVISGGTINNNIIGGSTPAAATVTNMTVTGSSIPANGMYLSSANNVGIAANSARQLRITGIASAVNYIEIFGATTGNIPTIKSAGSDTNISLVLGATGTGSIFMHSSSAPQFKILQTSSAVNYLEATGGVTGAPGTATLASKGTDSDINIVLNPKGSGTVDVSTSRITSVTDPSSAQDAATKAYVDANVTGASNKTPVVVATTTTLPANTYNNGASGVGATLTGNSNGAFAAVDGVTLTVNQRILVKNEGTGANNGLYQLSTVGTGGAPYVLTRVTDADINTEIAFSTVLVSSGTTNGGTTWNLPLASGSITMGSTTLTFVQTGLGSATSFIDLSEVVVSTVTRNTDAAVNQINWQLAAADMLYITQTTTAGHGFSNSLFVRRTADYNGGASGWVNSAGRFVTDAGADTDSFEWALLGVVNNSSPDGENVGVYGQGNADVATAGGTWGGTMEAHDKTGTDRAGATIGLEVDVWAVGANANRNRIGINIVSGNVDGGSPSECWAGLYITSVNATADGYYKNAIHIGNDPAGGGTTLTTTTAININCNGTTGVWDNGTKTVGFNAAGTYTGAAYRMNQGSFLSYDGSDLTRVKYDGTYIEHNTPIQIVATGSGNAIIEASGCSGFLYGIDFGASSAFTSGYVLRSGRISLGNGGIVQCHAQTVLGSAGSLAGYAYFGVGNPIVNYKIQLYNA